MRNRRVTIGVMSKNNLFRIIGFHKCSCQSCCQSVRQVRQQPFNSKLMLLNVGSGKKKEKRATENGQVEEMLTEKTAVEN